MGVIGRPHGVRGLVHVHSYAAEPADLAGYSPLRDESGREWSLAWRGEGIAELRDAEGRPLPDRTAAERLVNGTLADFTRAMRALAAGDLEAAKAHFELAPVTVHSRDEVGDMALNFNRLQEEIGRAAGGLEHGHTAGVVVIVSVGSRDQRAGINNDQRRPD